MFKVGDTVQWKAGSERLGRIIAISGPFATVKAWDDEEGEFVLFDVALRDLLRAE